MKEWSAIGERRRRGCPEVWVGLAKRGVRTKRRIVELGRDLGWNMLDLNLYLGNLPPGPPRGVFVDTVWDDPLTKRLQQIGCPLVRVGKYIHPRDDKLPSVIEDGEAAGRMGAEHFAARRFRHVGFVGYGKMKDLQPLYDGLEAGARELGMECHLLAFEDHTREFVAETTLSERHRFRMNQFVEWMQKVPKPLGLLGFSDGMAGRLSVAALGVGLDIPSQVAFLGHGNDPVICESAPVPLSSIDPGMEQHGEAAIRLMQDLMAGEPAPTEAVMVPPVGTVVRESSDVLAANDLVVASAIRWLWDHLRKDLAVDDVAAAVSVPRRRLERKFKDQLGHGINAELRRRRLERCCEYLTTSELSVTDIAPLCGFRDKNYLHRAFRKLHGITPRKYRLNNCHPDASRDGAPRGRC